MGRKDEFDQITFTSTLLYFFCAERLKSSKYLPVFDRKMTIRFTVLDLIFSQLFDLYFIYFGNHYAYRELGPKLFLSSLRGRCTYKSRRAFISVQKRVTSEKCKLNSDAQFGAQTIYSL